MLSLCWFWIKILTEKTVFLKAKARVIAETSDRAIEDKAIIDKILTHLDSKMPCSQTAPLSQVRAPPAACLFT